VLAAAGGNVVHHCSVWVEVLWVLTRGTMLGVPSASEAACKVVALPPELADGARVPQQQSRLRAVMRHSWH
jgi:hypothetical protein